MVQYGLLGRRRPCSMPHSREPREEGIGLLHDGCNRLISRNNRAVTRSSSGVGTNTENRQCRPLHAGLMETPSHVSEKQKNDLI